MKDKFIPEIQKVKGWYFYNIFILVWLLCGVDCYTFFFKFISTLFMVGRQLPCFLRVLMVNMISGYGTSSLLDMPGTSKRMVPSLGIQQMLSLQRYTIIAKPCKMHFQVTWYSIMNVINDRKSFDFYFISYENIKIVFFFNIVFLTQAQEDNSII